MFPRVEISFCFLDRRVRQASQFLVAPAALQAFTQLAKGLGALQFTLG